MTEWNKYPEQNKEFVAHKINKRRQELNESKQYSSWDQTLVAAQVEVADEMLRRFNPGHTDNPWRPTGVDYVPNGGKKTLATFGDDNRGMEGNVGLLISIGAKGNDE